MSKDFLITQIYYDEATKGHCNTHVWQIDNSLDCDKFFENTIIVKIVKMPSLKSHLNFKSAHFPDASIYLGILSWQFKFKCFLMPEEAVTKIHEDNYSVPVYDFSVSKKTNINMWRQAEIWHTGIVAAAQLIMDKMGFAHNLLELETPVIYQNHFIATLEVYRKYVADMLHPALEVMRNAEGDLLQFLNSDSGYKEDELRRDNALRERITKITGFPYYTMHTFICERLFATWCAVNPQYKIKHINA